VCPLHSGTKTAPKRPVEIRISRPTPGLHLALDPRIPDELERFALELEGLPKGSRVVWHIDGEPFAESSEDKGRSLWPPSRGRHVAKAEVWRWETGEPVWAGPVAFRVK
jgi:penicillin-binding protein 1C